MEVNVYLPVLGSFEFYLSVGRWHFGMYFASSLLGGLWIEGDAKFRFPWGAWRDGQRRECYNWQWGPIEGNYGLPRWCRR